MPSGGAATGVEDAPPLLRRRRLPLAPLRSLSEGLTEPRWRHWVLDYDAIGRITLPDPARGLVDADQGTIDVATRGLGLVLGLSAGGHRLPVDNRGRMVLPGWLRRLTEPSSSVLLAVRLPDLSRVVICPAAALDAVADAVSEGD